MGVPSAFAFSVFGAIVGGQPVVEVLKANSKKEKNHQ
jgi:hypothetical protein